MQNPEPILPENASVVCIGASNLVRGVPAVAALSRNRFGKNTEIYSVSGHGRSYLGRSSFFFRTLPGILDSGLWEKLSGKKGHIKSIVTDIGNDIMYGYSEDEILNGAVSAVERLRKLTSDITVTGLPVHNLDSLNEMKFRLFKNIFFPQAEITLADAMNSMKYISESLKNICAQKNLRFVPLEKEWYGFDPIHFRIRRWKDAWGKIFSDDPDNRSLADFSVLEFISLYAKMPEEMELFGKKRNAAQTGIRLKKGGILYLY